MRTRQVADHSLLLLYYSLQRMLFHIHKHAAKNKAKARLFLLILQFHARSPNSPGTQCILAKCDNAAGMARRIWSWPTTVHATHHTSKATD